MRKWLKVVLLIVIVFGVSNELHHYAAPKTSIEMLDDAMQSVVEVLHSNYPNQPASGSYIGDGIILTAKHVSIHEEVDKVRFEDGTECKVIGRYNHPDIDVGLLFIEKIDKPILKFDNKKLYRGTVIYVLGSPMGQIFNCSKGIVSNTTREPRVELHGNIELIQVDAYSCPGSSGSAVIDEDGEIRAILVGGTHTPCGGPIIGSGVCISTEHILKVIEDYNAFQK